MVRPLCPEDYAIFGGISAKSPAFGLAVLTRFIPVVFALLGNLPTS